MNNYRIISRLVQANICLLLLSTFCSGKPGHGLDSAKLQEITDKMQAFVDANETTGIVTLAARNGEIAYFNAFGQQTIEPAAPMKKDSIFWAASISKPFSAIAIMMLVEEGKLKLDDPLEKHIPEFKGILMTVPDYDIDAREIKLVEPKVKLTIEHILNHTHGIPMTTHTEYSYSIKGRAMASANATLDWEPGSKWRYGGEGITLAAYLVELYSGMSYEDFLQSRIFDPLGMKDTYFMRGDVPKDRMVERYTKNKDTNSWDVWTTYREKTHPTTYFRPDGGLYSTAMDLFVWHQTMLNGGIYKGKRIVSEESVKTVSTISCGHLDKGGHMEGCYYGLGFQVVRTPLTEKTKMLNPGSYGHGGSGGSTIFIDPETDVIYILMRNNYGSNINPQVEAFQQTVSDAIQ